MVLLLAELEEKSMASIALPIIAGATSLLGGIYGNRPQQQKKNTQSNINSDQSGNSRTTPDWDPATNALRMQLLQQFGQQAGQDVDTSGYAAQGRSNINQAGDVRTNAIKNSLAARGLSYSPVSAIAPAMSDSARIGDVASFENTLPLVQQQMKLQNLNAAGGFFKGLPIGSTSDAFSTTHGSQTGEEIGTTNGNEAGGGLASLATTLAGLYGKGAFGGGKK